MADAERKLELTRYLRQEQNLNRMKVKNREDILYGTGKNSEMLYGDEGLELAEYDRIREQGHKGPMFGLRLAVSLILFAGVIYLDKNQIAWQGQNATEVISRQLEESVFEKMSKTLRLRNNDEAALASEACTFPDTSLQRSQKYPIIIP